MLLNGFIKLRMQSIKKWLLLVCGMVLLFGVLGMCAGFLIYTMESLPILGIFASLAYSFLQIGMSIAIGAGSLLTAYSVFAIYGTDQSSLFFSLPLERKDLYKAGVISYIISNLVFGFAAVIGYILYFIPMSAGLDVFEVVSNIPLPGFTVAGVIYTVFIIIGIIMFLVTGILFGAVSINACSIYGCSRAKKHKLLASVVTYFVFNTITSGITTVIFTVISFISMIIISATEQSDGAMLLLITVSIYIAVAANVVGTVICHRVATKKLETKLDIG